MEFIVKECASCGGYCCRCIAVSKNFPRDSIPFWEPLTPDQMQQHGAWLPRRYIRSKIFFKCLRLSPSGLCTRYEERPPICRDYPDVTGNLDLYLENPDAFYVPWCAFRLEVLEVLGVPYQLLDTGVECLQKYLQRAAQGSYAQTLTPFLFDSLRE